MATDTAEAPAEQAAAEEAPAAKGGIIKIAALLLTVMLVQGVATYFLLPKPEEDAADVLAAEEDEGDDDTVEVSIDKFQCTNVAAAEHPIHVSLNVVAVVHSKDEVDFDTAANKTFKARVRQVVIKVIRSATMPELRETGWNTTRRRIKEEVNKLLRKSFIVDVVFDEYQTMAQ